MSTFLKKVARAFVEEEGGPAGPSPKTDTLEAFSDDAATLLSQLGKTAPASPSHAAKPPVLKAGDTKTGASAGPTSALPSVGMSADDVFRAAGISDTPNSAQRLLKMLAGLSTFPAHQQLTMIRAMDAADDAWDEPSVLKDAQARQTALRQHLHRITQERTAQTQAMTQAMEKTQAGGAAVLAEIDRQIQELQARRAKEEQETARELARLQAQNEQLTEAENEARRQLNKVIDSFSKLIVFFQPSGGPPPHA